MKLRFLFVTLSALSLLANASAQSTDVFRRRNIETTMLAVAKWQLAHPKHPLYDWTNGAFYAGIFAAYRTTHDPALMRAMLEMGEKNEWRPGPRFDHADDLTITQTYLDLYRLTKNRKMLYATRAIADRLKSETGPEVAKHGITWWWCDALFMGPPALAKLARITGDRSYLELNDRFFRETYDLLYHHEEDLYARDASYLIDAQGNGKREANGKRVFWSRGNGWVVGGLVRLLEELPSNYPTRKFYLDQYRAMTEKIVALQQPDGLWRASLLDPDSFPGGEASGSGFYIYALAWGINHRILSRDKYLPDVKRAWAALNTLVHPDGMVGWTQPIGADPRRNFGPESWEVYGAGAFLLAGSEMAKLSIK